MKFAAEYEAELLSFSGWLTEEEKSLKTREKYLRDVQVFLLFTEGRPLSKELVVLYKQHLIEKQYAVRSINSMLASINSYLKFSGKEECIVKSLRIQREIYCREKCELSKKEYLQLLDAARSDPRLYYLLQTIAGTGIRVSELEYFTVEALKKGEVIVSCKSKYRRVLLPVKLKKALLSYAQRNGIKSGCLFRTKNGNPLDRSNIWHMMKDICGKAGVEREKVFPHNLRKLFARTFYSFDRDISGLADILGHSSINTTRIYIASSGLEHRERMEKLGLVT